jgi:hypothetical protein
MRTEHKPTEPDPDLVLLASLLFAAEPEGDASGAKAAIGRLALKLYVLEQCSKGRDKPPKPTA